MIWNVQLEQLAGADVEAIVVCSLDADANPNMSIRP